MDALQSDERRKWYRTMRDAWLSPAGVMIVLGAIIWGVQLNIAIVEINKHDGRQDARLQVLEAIGREQVITQARTVALLDEIARRLDRHDKRINKVEDRPSAHGGDR